MHLAEFDITYISQKSINGQAIADHLTENPFEDYKPMTDFIPDESILDIETKEEYPSECMYLDEWRNDYACPGRC